MNDTHHWIRITELESIPRQGSRLVTHAEGRIALFRTADDQVFALADRCPHKGGPLSQGMLCGRQVTCPMHGWRIDVENGQAAAPDEGCADTLPVRLTDGIVYLGVAA